MVPDYHIHTPHCGHARGTVVEYVEQALRNGFTEIGFADHLGRYYLTRSQRRRHWDWGMDERGIARYFTELTDVREAYAGRIAIKVGLEVDYVSGAEEMLAPLIRLYPFDFLLGSVHCLPRFGWQHLVRLTSIPATELYTEYFAVAARAVESGLFQSLAHPDFIWRHIPWPKGDGESVYDLITSLVATAGQGDTCLEINLNGFAWSLINERPGSRDPFEVLVDAVQRNKVRVSLGSDAHTPDAVGKSFPEMVDYLRDHGLGYAATFDRGVRTMVKLD